MHLQQVNGIEFLHSTGLAFDTTKAWLKILEFDWEDAQRANKLHSVDYRTEQPVFLLPVPLTTQFYKWFSKYKCLPPNPRGFEMRLSWYSEDVGTAPNKAHFFILEEEYAQDRDISSLTLDFKNRYRKLIQDLQLTLNAEISVDTMLF